MDLDEDDEKRPYNSGSNKDSNNSNINGDSNQINNSNNNNNNNNNSKNIFINCNSNQTPSILQSKNTIRLDIIEKTKKITIPDNRYISNTIIIHFTTPFPQIHHESDLKISNRNPIIQRMAQRKKSSNKDEQQKVFIHSNTLITHIKSALSLIVRKMNKNNVFMYDIVQAELLAGRKFPNQWNLKLKYQNENEAKQMRSFFDSYGIGTSNEFAQDSPISGVFGPLPNYFAEDERVQAVKSYLLSSLTCSEDDIQITPRYEEGRFKNSYEFKCRKSLFDNFKSLSIPGTFGQVNISIWKNNATTSCTRCWSTGHSASENKCKVVDKNNVPIQFDKLCGICLEPIPAGTDWSSIPNEKHNGHTPTFCPNSKHADNRNCHLCVDASMRQARNDKTAPIINIKDASRHFAFECKKHLIGQYKCIGPMGSPSTSDSNKKKAPDPNSFPDMPNRPKPPTPTSKPPHPKPSSSTTTNRNSRNPWGLPEDFTKLDYKNALHNFNNRRKAASTLRESSHEAAFENSESQHKQNRNSSQPPSGTYYNQHSSPPPSNSSSTDQLLEKLINRFDSKFAELDQRICQLTVLIKESHASLEDRMGKMFTTQTTFMANWATLFSSALCTVLPASEIPAFKSKVDKIASAQETSFKSHMAALAKAPSNTGTPSVTAPQEPSSPQRSSEPSITLPHPTPNPKPPKRNRRESEIDISRNKHRSRSSSLSSFSSSSSSSSSLSLHADNYQPNESSTNKSSTPYDDNVIMDESRSSTLNGNDLL